MTLPVVTSNWRDMAMSNVMNDTREAKCMETYGLPRVLRAGVRYCKTWLPGNNGCEFFDIPTGETIIRWCGVVCVRVGLHMLLRWKFTLTIYEASMKCKISKICG